LDDDDDEDDDDDGIPLRGDAQSSGSDSDRVDIDQHRLNILKTNLPLVDEIGFRIAAEMYLEKLNKALSEMEEFNENFGVVRLSQTKLQLDCVMGRYIFEAHIERRLMTMFSPKEGEQQYALDRQHDWVSLKDGHQMIDLFLREVGTYCQGIPSDL